MDSTRIIATVATEAVEEPDAIARHPEIVDVLASLSTDAALCEAMERAAPGVMLDPAAYVQLADALGPYRQIPLDDAPELVQALAFLAWVLERAVADTQPTSETAALVFA